MGRYFYADDIALFRETSENQIIGNLTIQNPFPTEPTQREAWLAEIRFLKTSLASINGKIYFEYSIPRMGKRIDVVLLIKHVIFILEFKVGEREFLSQAIDQVWDYSLDLKNFHQPSHNAVIAPILIATNAEMPFAKIAFSHHNDQVIFPIKCNNENIESLINQVIETTIGEIIDPGIWEIGQYSPTPTIIEAAISLYNGHTVSDISRNDASAVNLIKTTKAISELLFLTKEKKEKSICFITGVPGAGKTLIGLNIATTHIDKSNELYSVFLSGNGPLVNILREALTRNKIQQKKENGKKLKKGDVKREISLFIQNVHHFRDDCLNNPNQPPIEHVAIFDEAQRAWNHEQTCNYMKRKRNRTDFRQSEPEFLISCLDRHKDWAVIVCLVGGGQEINTGEAGIGEWISSLDRSFKNWNIYASSKLIDAGYGLSDISSLELSSNKFFINEDLHLSVSMRSFRAENVSSLIKSMLDLEFEKAREIIMALKNVYPIVITRNLQKAKEWLKSQARGSERYGLIVSSQAERLKPYAIDVKSPMDPIHWFLDGKDDVRSSYYLEDVASEFDIQGLELDWACITWDADFRYSKKGWEHWSFKGNKWYHINKAEKKIYQKNAYRVLLTRARQGMIIVIPEGDKEDLTRMPEFYDPTFLYLSSIGFSIL